MTARAPPGCERYDHLVVELPFESAETWCLVTAEPIAVPAALEWATVGGCGAVVTFCGTVRDHSDGRPGVDHLDYECYEEHATAALEHVAGEARARWPMTGRIALIHRIGRIVVGEVTVTVVVSSPHRAEAFDAARFCIDTLKATAPIWKEESWAGGSDWATGSHPLVGEDAVIE